jgi:prepilin-type N-terminal cleavage/methylation domain-containing protein
MKRKKGFSLVEILLSIAVFSILSVFVLQMFSTARNLNENARELDRSVVVAESIFERIQAVQSFETLGGQRGFEHAAYEDENDASVMTLHYDEAWKTIPVTESAPNYKVVVRKQDVPTFNHVVTSYQLKVIKTDPSDRVKESVLYELEMEIYYR